MDSIYKAAILDLDGVITQTASVHAKAWQRMFDEYNETRKQNGEKPFATFSVDQDYYKHLDGMPRYVGVANFLSSRTIELPHGSPSDNPGNPTICGLGNLKNQYFREIIEQEGVHLFKSNVEQIKTWRKQGMKTAVVSSSKNCQHIIKSAGIEELFDVRVDGKIAADLGLKGKPCPDTFLEAARRLKVDPDDAFVVEDATAGVEAGRKGGFRLVIGIANNGNEEELKNHGANIVVADLNEVDLQKNHHKTFSQLPDAGEHLDDILNKAKSSKLFLFFDFDGTLTPIVDQPEQAHLSEDMFTLLFQLSQLCPTGVISGRDLRDIADKVNLEGLFYAGSHGFEIEGPDGFHHENEAARNMVEALEQLYEQLNSQLADIPNATVEHKKYTLSVHYRNVDDQYIESIRKKVNEALNNANALKSSEGKKLIEIKPALNWHKGKAVEYLIEQHTDDPGNTYTVYLGDDITDEDVFKTITHGAGILIGDHQKKTHADYKLDNVKSVEIFLHKLLTHLKY